MKTKDSVALRLPAILLLVLALAPAANAQRGRDDDRRDDDRRDGQKGVTLYEDENFRGRREFFTQDDPRLADNRIGNDSVSSIRVDRGCRVTIYRDDRYKGASDVIDEDWDNLYDTRVGDDEVSSIEVRCAGRGGNTDGDYGFGEGITLYVNSDFRGRSESFTHDVRDLRGTQIGNDQASSLRLARGCEAILYSDVNFRGDSIAVDYDVPNLGETEIGNDQVSSVEVRCRRRR
jgi:hypothetical protein